MTADALQVDPHARQKPKVRHRSPTGMGRYVTDLELAEWLGVPLETVRPVLAALDKDPSKNFPKKQKLWGDRRYLPALQQWFDKLNNVKVDASFSGRERP